MAYVYNASTYNNVTELGFAKIPTFTLLETYTLKLGRYRYLSLSSLGTPNEMIFICQTPKDDQSVVEDIVCLHNFDFDGNISLQKLSDLVKILTTDGCAREKEEISK